MRLIFLIPLLLLLSAVSLQVCLADDSSVVSSDDLAVNDQPTRDRLQPANSEKASPMEQSARLRWARRVNLGHTNTRLEQEMRGS